MVFINVCSVINKWKTKKQTCISLVSVRLKAAEVLTGSPCRHAPRPALILSVLPQHHKAPPSLHQSDAPTNQTEGTGPEAPPEWLAFSHMMDKGLGEQEERESCADHTHPQNLTHRVPRVLCPRERSTFAVCSTCLFAVSAECSRVKK